MKLIDKDALIGKIEKRMQELHPTDTHKMQVGEKMDRDVLMWLNALSWVKDCINAAEVKEVDLDNEYIEEVYSHLDSIKDTADRMTSGNFMHNKAAIKFSVNTIVEVLELMGIKAQK